MEIIFYSLLALMSIAIITIIAFADKIEKAHIERCERWKKEQMEAGMPEEFVDQMLLSDPDFIL
jgi:hypothetical protein